MNKIAALTLALLAGTVCAVPVSAGSCHGTPKPVAPPPVEPEPTTHVGVSVDVETAEPAAVATSVTVNGQEAGGVPAAAVAAGGVKGADVSMGAARRNARRSYRATVHGARDAHRAARLGGRAAEAANEAAINDSVRRVLEQ